MSKQRSLRKSKLSFADEEDEEDGNTGSVAILPTAVRETAQQKQLKKDKKSATLLSFDDGGEDEDGQGSVSITANALSKGKGKSKPSLRRPPGSIVTLPTASTGYNTQVAAAGEYTAERLKELQSSTQRAPRTIKPAAAGTGGTSMPLLPPPSATVIEEEDMDIEDVDELLRLNVPNEAAIRAAKAKREQLRSGGGVPDYIDLASGGKDRLSSLEPFALGMKGIGSKKIQGAAAAASAAARYEDEEDVVLHTADQDEEGDEEVWAEEQIRKGMRSAELGTRAAIDKKKKKKKNLDATTVPSSTAIGTAAGFLPPSQSAAVAAAADEVVSSLRAALRRAQLSQRQAEKNLVRTGRNLEDCIAGLKRMEEEIEQAGEKYIFIQQLRAYIVDICSMLAEKSPLVEELQDELQRAREERYTAYFRRCLEIEAEERLPAEAAVAAALSVLSTGSCGVKEATAAAAEAADKEEEKLLQGKHIPIELDEFGRDLNVTRRSKVATRISNRYQNYSRRSQRKDGKGEQYPDDDTTSESEDEVETYTRRKREVLEASETVFRDAADEYGSLKAVKTRLERWKLEYRGQYNDAYMAESVPALFAPFVRQELLSWNPLDQARGKVNVGGKVGITSTNGNGVGSNDDGENAPIVVVYQGFDQQEWHKLLFDYGMPSDGTAPDPNDPDVDLVPKIVRALVVPFISATVTRCWRVLSTCQSKIVASMLVELMVYLDSDSEALVGVVQATLSRLNDAVENLVVPSWPSMALAATPRGEQYMERAFSRGLRLLRSVCCFHQVIPADKLQNLAVQQLAVKHLLPYIRVAIVDPEVLAKRAGRLLDALPADWIHNRLITGLEGVSEVVQAAVRALEPSAGKQESRTAKKLVAKGLAGVLERLGDVNGAQRLKLLFDAAE